MSEPLAHRPRAIYPHELSNQQLVKLHRCDPRLIVSAWRTHEGFVVYLEGPKPNAYIWRKRTWADLLEDV